MLIDLQREPSRRELAWFGVALGCFFGVVGTVVWWRTGVWPAAWALWGVGAVVVAVYYAVAPWRRPIHRVWSYGTYPVGWVVTHLVLALVYYGLLTPVGLALRLFGRDPMARRFDREAGSYWQERKQSADPERYFRQF